MTPRIGFAGLGWIGRNRMDALQESGFAEAAMLCDPALASSWSFDDLLNSDVDAIVVATPNALHAEQSIAALERGKAVFCQKPLGRDANETKRVVDCARANDRLLGVDLSYRHTDAMKAVRQLVRDGELGEIFAADLRFHNAYGPDKPWFYDRAQSGGGCVLDLGIHLVDLALWTLDFPRVDHVSARLHSKNGSVEDYATARIDVANGASVNIDCSWNLSAGRDCRIDVVFYGTRGAAGFHNVDGSFYDFAAERYDGTRTLPLTSPPDAWGGRAICAWGERLAQSPSFDPGIESIVAVAETLDAIYAEGARR